MSEADTPIAVDVREAGRLLGLSERTLWRLIKLNKIKAHRIGSRVRVDRASVIAFFENAEAA
jgi:excisionase family DNA binding protein